MREVDVSTPRSGEIQRRSLQGKEGVGAQTLGSLFNGLKRAGTSRLRPGSPGDCKRTQRENRSIKSAFTGGGVNKPINGA